MHFRQCGECEERVRNVGTKIKSNTSIAAPTLEVGFRRRFEHTRRLLRPRCGPTRRFACVADCYRNLRRQAGLLCRHESAGRLLRCRSDGRNGEGDCRAHAHARRLPGRRYGTDSVKINVEQISKLLSPGAEVMSL